MELAFYNWIDDPIHNYVHHVHHHGHGDFCYSIDSTSHNEQLWNHIKHLIKSIYNIIPNKNLALFLEFIRNHKNFFQKKNLIIWWKLVNMIIVWLGLIFMI